MAENQIPKATMANFIRQRIKDKRKISAEFIQTMLDLSKEYIDKVGALSNEICEKEGKKTISTDHFYKSLKQLHMEDIIPTLHSTEEFLKKKQQHKQEIKEKVQENIQRRNELNKQEENEEEQQKPYLEVNNKELKPIIIDDDEDFGGFLNEDDE